MSSMLSQYSKTPKYKPQFKLTMRLKKELESATKQELKQWILIAINDGISTDILKKGLYSVSNIDSDKLKSLLKSLQTIKTNNATITNDTKSKISDIDDIKVPSPPPFEFDVTPDSVSPTIPLTRSDSGTFSLLSLSNTILSFICSYNDLDSLLRFEKCSKRLYIIAREPDSYHNMYLNIKYSLILRDSMDTLHRSLLRFMKTKQISIDHYGKYNGNDVKLWKSIIDCIYFKFISIETLIFGIDWIGISYLSRVIDNETTIRNLYIKHSLQKKKKKKNTNSNSKIIYWERTKKEEITEIDISCGCAINRLISAFKSLNNVTFDMLRFPPIFEIFNCLRTVPIECIAFNDCVELGFFDANAFIYNNNNNNMARTPRPFLCQSIIIRDIDSNTFDEFFDPLSAPYLWPLRIIKNLMIHWNITQRDYNSFINANMKRRHVQKQEIKKYKEQRSFSCFPNLSCIETLYISIINGNGVKSLILFLNDTQLTHNLKVFVLRIPKYAAKTQIALNNDLARLFNLFNNDLAHLIHLRLEIVSFSWISIWNTLNVVANAINDIDSETLQTLQIYLHSPYNKDKDTKDLIMKIKNSISSINIKYLALYIHQYNMMNINVNIWESFRKDGYTIQKQGNEYCCFIRKMDDQDDIVSISHMDQYWEPVGIDPYA